jgi:uncharacterized protein (TIGR00288 family)
VSVDVMEQGLRLLMNQHGGVHVRRAYCTAESAVKHQAFFKRMGIKPMVNLAAGKNSTDIALAVDAMDLVLAERPDVVVIASSDSDFAPLVHRLREKGCVVRGLGQKGKTGDETQDVYDDYTVLEHRKSASSGGDRQAPPARKTAARKTSSRGVKAQPFVQVSAPVPVPAPAPVVAPVPVREPEPMPMPMTMPVPAVLEEPVKPATRARKTAAKKAAPVAKKVAEKVEKVEKVEKAPRKTAAKTAAKPDVKPAAKTAARKLAKPAVPELVAPVPAPVPAPAPAPVVAAPAQPQGRGRSGTQLQAVLNCLPELVAGQGLALNVAVQRLREAQLLGKNSSSLKLFSQLSDRFELHPQNKPSQVRWRG